jgi:hypothetical protein
MLGYSGPPLLPLAPGQYRETFQYTTNITFSGANQRSPLTIQLDGSAVFEMVSVAVSSTDTPQPNVMALVSIKDSSTGYSLMSDQIPIEHFAATSVRVKYLAATYRFPSNGTIQLDVTNQGSGGQRIFITLQGFKIKTLPSLAR